VFVFLLPCAWEAAREALASSNHLRLPTLADAERAKDQPTDVGLMQALECSQS